MERLSDMADVTTFTECIAETENNPLKPATCVGGERLPSQR